MPDTIKKETRSAEGARYKVEGPISGQTLAEYLNRTNVSPVLKTCLLEKESKEEALDIVLTGVERHPWENKLISSYIKNQLDTKLGASWHVIVGEAYSFDIGYEANGLLYLYYGSLAILAYKCGSILGNENG